MNDEIPERDAARPPAEVSRQKPASRASVQMKSAPANRPPADPEDRQVDSPGFDAVSYSDAVMLKMLGLFTGFCMLPS